MIKLYFKYVGVTQYYFLNNQIKKGHITGAFLNNNVDLYNSDPIYLVRNGFHPGYIKIQSGLDINWTIGQK
jgi:hypothetical protein